MGEGLSAPLSSPRKQGDKLPICEEVRCRWQESLPACGEVRWGFLTLASTHFAQVDEIPLFVLLYLCRFEPLSFSDYLSASGQRARRGGRVVEGTGLENRQAMSLVGSNPTLSATYCCLVWSGGLVRT